MKSSLLTQLTKPRHTDYMMYVTINGLGAYNPYHVPLWVLKIMREDPQVSFGLTAVKAPIMSANYYMAKDDPNEAPINPEIKIWVEKLFNKKILPKLFGVGLNCLDYGFQPFEIIWQATRDGNKRGYEVKDLLEIEPDRVSLKYNKDTGDYLGFTTHGGESQNDGVSRFVDKGWTSVNKVIPKEKSFIFTHKQEYQRLEGRALSKYAYIPWYHSCFLYMAAMRYFESRGTPPLIGMAPTTPNVAGDPDATDPPDEDNMNTLVEQMITLRSGGVAALPYDPDDLLKMNKWAISVLSDDKRGDMFLDFIRHLEMKILRGLWIPERHLTQDAKGTGSYAMAAEHSNAFYELLEIMIKDIFLREVNNHLIPRLVDPLFGKQKSYPTIACAGVSKAMKALNHELMMTLLKEEHGEISKELSIARLLDIEEIMKKCNVPLLAKEDRPPIEVKPEPEPKPVDVEDDEDDPSSKDEPTK